MVYIKKYDFNVLLKQVDETKKYGRYIFKIIYNGIKLFT